MSYAVNRRHFLATVASASLAGIASRAGAEPMFTAPADRPFWGMLLHFGTNMWSDVPVQHWGPLQGEDLKDVVISDTLRFNESVWRVVTDRMRQAGMNLLVIDMGEALQYQSHPELAAKDAWPIDRFRAELARLRKMGIEPIPKLNFSTAHDTWLKEYGRQVSTPTYYKVCADMIREVCAIFDKPRFFHLGYDEETAANQTQYGYVVVRQGELWWHDFLFFVKTIEDLGVRPWIWSDYYWHHPELFLKRMPKSVLQSNWYYGGSFDAEKLAYVRTYQDLEKAGYDQVPTGSNWSCDTNMGGTVQFCKQAIAKERLKGFLMAPWFFTLSKSQNKLLQAVEQVEAAKRTFG
ncbi:MAG: Tat pathway signal protein [Kiritimatiellae bacterium]|nr:Tat pathway signal protein [Kiritimatiellia bacterium]